MGQQNGTSQLQCPPANPAKGFSSDRGGPPIANLDAKILSVFYASDSRTVTRAELAGLLDAPPSRVTDSIQELRRVGFCIESHPLLGYRLLDTPDDLIADDLIARMANGFSDRACVPASVDFSNGAGRIQIGNRILVFEKTSSTNDVAQRMATEGHPAGLAVFAESQTAGRGRHGRKWISPAHKGLWFTLLLRPSFPAPAASRLTVMAAVAAAASLRRSTGLPLRIKWPNDILCNGRKVAGILLELSAEGSEIRHAVLGIGIDVNLDKSDFPDWLRPHATSLKLEAGKSFHRPALAADILIELNACATLLSDKRFPNLLERWLELDETLGKQISVARNGSAPLRGLAINLDMDGALLVRADDGRIERVTSGDVTLEIEPQ